MLVKNMIDTPQLPTPYQSEKGLQEAIMDYLLLRGFLVVRVNAGMAKAHNRDGSERWITFARWQYGGMDQPSNKGIADILVALSPTGEYYAFEVKAPGKRDNLSPEQVAFLAAVNFNKGKGHVVDDLQMVIDLVEKGYY